MEKPTAATVRTAKKLARGAAGAMTGVHPKEIGRGKHPVANNTRKTPRKGRAK